MQQRLNCVWKYVSYNEEYGRAGESLICGMRRHVYGFNNVWPAMDWDRCQLHCGSHQYYVAQMKTTELSLSNLGQHMHFQRLQPPG